MNQKIDFFGEELIIDRKYLPQERKIVDTQTNLHETEALKAEIINIKKWINIDCRLHNERMLSGNTQIKFIKNLLNNEELGKYNTLSVRKKNIYLLQFSLQKLKYQGVNNSDINTDGEFGQHTLYALLCFQKKNGLRKDGIAGQETINKILSLLHLTSGQYALEKDAKQNEKVKKTVNNLENKHNKIIYNREAGNNLRVFRNNDGKFYYGSEEKDNFMNHQSYDLAGNYCEVNDKEIKSLAVIRNGNEYNYIDAKGNIKISEIDNKKIIFADDFSHSIARVKTTDGRWYYIKPNGSILCALEKFDYLENITLNNTNQLIGKVKKGNKWYQVDIHGENYNLTEINDKLSVINKKVNLTFDDGPNENTEKVANMLENYNMRGTFFIVGKHIFSDINSITSTDKNRILANAQVKMLIELVKRGHNIGNHTNNHNPVSQNINLYYQNQIKNTEYLIDLIYEAAGAKNQKLFRFPGLKFENDEKLLAYLQNKGYTISRITDSTNLNYDTKDRTLTHTHSNKYNANKLENMISNVPENKTILFHDKYYNYKNIGRAGHLEIGLKQLKKDGKSSVGISN